MAGSNETAETEISETEARPGEVRHFRTLFISDVHLGSKAAKMDFLVDFLRYHDADTIILVGDIIDGWRLRRNWYWPQGCTMWSRSSCARRARAGA